MNAVYDADVIVIGSGAVGSNAAYELAKQGKSVILLEAGERIPRWKLIQNFHNTARRKDNIAPFPNQPWAPTSGYDGYIANTGNQLMTPGQLKLVGGTTWHWGGAAWRLIPNDFKLKTLYGVGRDWPIEYQELEPYYVRAEYEIGVAGDNGEDQAGNVGGAYPPRSQPYRCPGKKTPTTRCASRNASSRWATTSSPSRPRGPAPVTAGARRAWATTTACRSARLAPTTRASYTPSWPKKRASSC